MDVTTIKHNSLQDDIMFLKTQLCDKTATESGRKLGSLTLVLILESIEISS